MPQVTGTMTSVVRGMDKAMKGMNLERVRIPLILYLSRLTAPKISLVMDKFEAQFADMDVQTSYMEDDCGINPPRSD